MTCPLEIADDMSALRAVRMGDHAEHGLIRGPPSSGGLSLCGLEWVQVAAITNRIMRMGEMRTGYDAGRKDYKKVDRKIVWVVSCASILVAVLGRHFSLPWYAIAATIFGLVVLPAAIWARRSLRGGLQ